MSEEQLCRRFSVTGRVQGVYFRASTRKRAMALGLKGYARNLDDGRVEVLACGKPTSLDLLEEWLWQGSSGAKVSHVEVDRVIDSESYELFVIS